MDPICPTFRYDVFLSFRGEDTRTNFTSHLYKALRRHNFDVFHDSSLPRGLGIGPQLLGAIKESRIFVVVFSTNYADSKWCLDELTQMMDCIRTDTTKRTVLLPVFLDVKQSDVRTQQGSYKVAPTHIEKKFDQETVQKWRDALQEAGQLDGLHLQDDANGDEEELLDQIVEKIRQLLHGPSYLINAADLHPVVGIESRVQAVISSLNPSCDDDVRVVAICGPAGIGKTTIAKATYDRLAIRFKARYSCFLPDVKTIFGDSNGKVTLQKMLISNLLQSDDSQICIDSYHQGIGRIERMIKHQKLLLVIDDVNDDEQLKILGMNRAIFGRGSRIIVTTRDESLHVVDRVRPDAKYEPRLLDESESLGVFCLNAFGGHHPKEGYEEVSKEAVRWGAGSPRAVKDSAALLRRFQSVEQWQWALKDLMQNSSW